MTSTDSTLLQGCAQSFVNKQLFSNVEWAIKQNGVLNSSGCIGYANAVTQSPLPNQPIYRIYSMTKPIVSVAALQLIEQQKLKLSDAVAQFIPAFASQKILDSNGKLHANPATMTVEQLFTHRSGLSYDFLPDCPVAALYREQTLVDNGSRSLAELVHALASTPLASQPGERWNYSYATDVLAHIVELVTQKPLSTVFQEQIFAPLGMTETAFSVPPEKRDRLLPMFGARQLGCEKIVTGAPQELTLLDVEASNPSTDPTHFMRGGHGLFSTSQDYMRFAEYLRTGHSESGQRLLCAALFDLMWTNRMPSAQLPLRIGIDPLPGYGWTLFGRLMLDTGQAQSITTLHEGGWAGAASTYFWVDRKNGVSGVVMSQYLGSTVALGVDMHSAATMSMSRQS